MNPPARLVLLCSTLLLLLTACRAEPAPPATPSSPSPVSPTTASLPPATVTPAATILPPGGITSLEDTGKALVRIRSQGQFLDPPGSNSNRVAGRGSGFIIDPSGIAVTNQHVVAGAEEISVWIGEDQVTAHPARVLGVSECYDLAVIDIEGDGYPYLNWSTQPLEFGLDIAVGGFGFEGPGYDLARGMLVGTELNGITQNTSVEKLLEYTARTPPGASGGPILSRDGALLGVHLGSASNGQSAEGLAAQIAHPIIDSLITTGNMDTLGISVQAVSDGALGIKGAWLSAVQPGTSAQTAGLQAGDVMTALSGRTLGEDGTLGAYCEIVRSSQPEDSLSFQAYRPSTGETFAGKLLAGGRLIPPTPTPTLKPRLDGVLNPQAGASGDVYFRYDFTHDLDGLEPSFTSGDPSSVSWDVANGTLNLDFQSIYTYVNFIYRDLETPDVRLDVRAANLGENNNYVSLICRYSDLGWYEFSVSSNGLYTIYRYDPTLSNPYDNKLAEGGSFDIRMGREENDYAAVCQGDRLSLYINDILVREITDSDLTTGQVGFSVASLNRTPVIVAIDQFSASMP